MKNDDRSPKAGKKAYNTPVLQVYGDLKKITMDIDAMATPMADGGGNSHHQATHA